MAPQDISGKMKEALKAARSQMIEYHQEKLKNKLSAAGIDYPTQEQLRTYNKQEINAKTIPSLMPKAPQEVEVAVAKLFAEENGLAPQDFDG